MKRTEAGSRKRKQATVVSEKKGGMTREKVTQPAPVEDCSTGKADYSEHILEVFESAPPEEALKALKEQLLMAGHLHNQNPNSRTGVQVAMEIVTAFVWVRYGETPAAPFAKLHDALKDLDAGTVSSLLQKKRTPNVGNRPVDTTDRKRMKALIVAACELLIERGDRVTNAMLKISKLLRKINFRISGTKEVEHPSAETIRYWRSEIKKDRDSLHQRDLFLTSLRSASSDLHLERALSSLFKLLGKPHS